MSDKSKYDTSELFARLRSSSENGSRTIDAPIEDPRAAARAAAKAAAQAAQAAQVSEPDLESDSNRKPGRKKKKAPVEIYPGAPGTTYGKQEVLPNGTIRTMYYAPTILKEAIRIKEFKDSRYSFGACITLALYELLRDEVEEAKQHGFRFAEKQQAEIDNLLTFTDENIL